MDRAKDILTIRVANYNDTKRVSDFRISQYKLAKEFKLLDTSLLSIQNGNVYIIETDGRIISTMQSEQCANEQDFKAICAVGIPSNFIEYETVYLSRAATLQEYRYHGLNSYIRKFILQRAILNININSLSGFAYEGAPRLSLLRNIGYKFSEVRFVNLSYAIPIGKVFFIKLERKDFERAFHILEDESTEFIQRFKIISEL